MVADMTAHDVDGERVAWLRSHGYGWLVGPPGPPVFRHLYAYWEAYLVAVICLALVFSLGYAVGNDDPSCPTPQSCSVTYHDGDYHIREVTP
jgi:hypothetical protein